MRRMNYRGFSSIRRDSLKVQRAATRLSTGFQPKSIAIEVRVGRSTDLHGGAYGYTAVACVKRMHKCSARKYGKTPTAAVKSALSSLSKRLR